MNSKSLGILVIALVILTGIALSAAIAVSGGHTMKAFSSINNSTTVTIKSGETFKVALDENPTTGYSWQVTVTPGLQLVDANGTYIPDGSGRIGAGGVHEWQVKATGTGEQQFTAIYKRPWEPTSGNEAFFVLDIKIE